MGRVNDWTLGMQEDAEWMSREVFIRVHGRSNVTVYDDFHNEDRYYEPEIPEEIFEAN
jgi:hypothetical protein